MWIISGLIRSKVLKSGLLYYELGDNFQELPPYVGVEDGEEVEKLRLARIMNPAGTSERLCMNLSVFDHQDDRSWVEKFWDDHGRQIINIGSGGLLATIIWWLITSLIS